MARTKLTTKQQRFVEEYCTDFNATQASIRAGYSPRTAGQIGHENLRKPDISAAIDARLARLDMATGEILARLSAMARGSIGSFIKCAEQGQVTVDPGSREARENMRLLKKLVVRVTEQGSGESRTVTTTVQLQLHDALDALCMLARMRGLYDMRQGSESQSGILVLPPSSRQRRGHWLPASGESVSWAGARGSPPKNVWSPKTPATAQAPRGRSGSVGTPGRFAKR